jgi:hypothetical protein
LDDLLSENLLHWYDTQIKNDFLPDLHRDFQDILKDRDETTQRLIAQMKIKEQDDADNKKAYDVLNAELKTVLHESKMQSETIRDFQIKVAELQGELFKKKELEEENIKLKAKLYDCMDKMVLKTFKDK